MRQISSRALLENKLCGPTRDKASPAVIIYSSDFMKNVCRYIVRKLHTSNVPSLDWLRVNNFRDKADGLLQGRMLSRKRTKARNSSILVLSVAIQLELLNSAATTPQLEIPRLKWGGQGISF